MIKTLPHPLLLFRRQPWSLVTYRYPRDGSRYLQAHRYHLVSRRVFKGIGQVIGEHLLDATRIGDHRYHLVWQQDQLDLTRPPSLPLIAPALLDDRDEILPLQRQPKFVHLQPA